MAEWNQLDVEQIQRVSKLLNAHGIEPSELTLQALIKTAETRYPNDPDRLEKVAQGILEFFSGSPSATTDAGGSDETDESF